jgi:hypothetical protein
LHAVVAAAQKDHFIWVVFDLDSSYAVLCTANNSQRLCDDYKSALAPSPR